MNFNDLQCRRTLYVYGGTLSYKPVDKAAGIFLTGFASFVILIL
jgi:hypothetical protein